MKTYIFFALLIVFSVSSCVSSKKHFRKGNFDQAIDISVDKLKRKPTKEKEIETLNRAYKYATMYDNERIEFLRKSGQPDIWEEVLIIYENMKRRQNRIRVLPVTVLDRIDFKLVNIDNEIIEAQKKAAAYLYAHALSLIENGRKESIRKAHSELLKIKNLYSHYKDVDNLLQKTLDMGTTYVHFNLRNSTDLVLHRDFEKELYKIGLADLNSKWVVYHSRKVENVSYDYVIVLNIRHIDLSPDMVKEVHYTETKEVADGFEYVLDANGNVMKDSLGNDIKVPKTKIISCNIIETQLSKMVTINSTIDLIETATGQLVKTNPMSSQYFFEHAFAIVHGDINALKPATLEKTRRKPIGFPHDYDMILNAADIIKRMSKDFILQYRRFIL